jgi:hypothetical protein
MTEFLKKYMKEPRSPITGVGSILCIYLVIFLFKGIFPTMALGHNSLSNSEMFYPYLVRIAEPKLLVAFVQPDEEFISKARNRQKDKLNAELQGLQADGFVGHISYVTQENAFLTELSALASLKLAGNPLIASIEEIPGKPDGSPSFLGDGTTGVSSVVFIQVYSPFIWGRTNIGGLNVQLSLEDGSGILKGVPIQGIALDSIKIDRTQLYFETVFVDPISRQSVAILPGDKVHIITTGDNPANPGLDPPEDKRITVDEVLACTSIEQDSVSGTAPPNSNIVITVQSLYPALLSYLTPGSGMTYAETTSGSDGKFYVDTFRTTNDSTYKQVNLQRGYAGFVRLRRSDGNEIYTVHGQNLFVLLNSKVIHGYAFSLPYAPNNPLLDPGVTVSRPATTVSAVLKNSSGTIKDGSPIFTGCSGTGCYMATFNNMITGGDIIEVAINQYLTKQVVTIPVAASVDLGGNQVVGTGPANTLMVAGAGQVSGYITSHSYVNFLEKQVYTDGSGGFATGAFGCGTNRTWSLRPGSFGYAGYENPCGHLVYLAFAAPTNHVMSDFPFVEGWVANGAIVPTMTLRESGGGIKQPALAANQWLLWMQDTKLIINTYYNMLTTQFILPGDIVNVNSGGMWHTIPVDRITSFVNTDNETVVGEAPPGVSVRVVPADDRDSRQEATADSGGRYSAGNPFKYLSPSSCSESNKTENFIPGDSGRAYIRHNDGNEVFAVYGRSMHVNENEKYVELYQFVIQDLDWWDTPRRTALLTQTHSNGTSESPVQAQAESTRPGKTKLYPNALIRPGDSILAAFEEGPEGLKRSVNWNLKSIALITGSPDRDASTLAGVGYKDWYGQATLNAISTKPAYIAPRPYTAYPPFQFVNSLSKPIELKEGYSGTVSFSDNSGNRVWVAWALTSIQVKITGWPKPGDTQVCGKAPPSSAITIYDVSTEGMPGIPIGSGNADSSSFFCVHVAPPLYEGQVIMAEAEGTFSQPVVVTLKQMFLPVIKK